MGKTHSPLLGFNNNVRHKNRVFHIQTEDSGIKHPHIITHLFMDGGRILKSVKKSYAEHVGTDGMQDTVRQMMKEQHKSMFIALRDGQFDSVVDEQVASKAKYDADTSAKKGGKSIAPAGGPVATAPAAAAPAAPPPSPAPAPVSPDGPVKHATQAGLAAVVPPTPPTAELEAKGADTKRESVVPSPSAQAAGVLTDTQKMASMPPEAAPAAAQARPPSTPPKAASSPPPRSAPPAGPLSQPMSPPMSASAPPVSDGAPRYPTPGKQRLVVLPEVDEAQPNTMRDPEPPPPQLDIDLNNSPQPVRVAAMADADLFRANDLPPPPQNLLKRKELTDRSTYRGGGDEERVRPKSAPPPKPPQRRSQPPPAPVTSRGRPVAPAPVPSPLQQASQQGGGRYAPAAASGSSGSSSSNTATHGASHGSSAPARYAPARPATIFGAPRGKASLFGDDLVTDKSLDEVILSYLAEDLEQAPKKK